MKFSISHETELLARPSCRLTHQLLRRPGVLVLPAFSILSHMISDLEVDLAMWTVLVCVAAVPAGTRRTAANGFTGQQSTWLKPVVRLLYSGPFWVQGQV